MRAFALFVLLFAVAPAMAADAGTDTPPAPAARQWHDGRGKPAGSGTKAYRPERAAQASGAPVYCENAAALKTVHVSIAALPPTYDYTRTAAELTAMTRRGFTSEELAAEVAASKRADDPNRQYLQHQADNHNEYTRVAGLTRPWISFSFKPNIIAKGVNAGAACVFVDSIALQVEQNFKVYIAAEAMRDPCRERHIKDHEDLHVTATGKVWDRYEDGLRALLQGYMDKSRAVRLYKDQFDAEVARINAELVALVQGKLKEAMAEDVKMQIMIDSNGEYDYFSKLACKE